METLLRPMERREQRMFFLCLVASGVAHVVLAFSFLGAGEGQDRPEVSRLAETFANAVNTVTDLGERERSAAVGILEKVDDTRWRLDEMAATLQWVASDLGVIVRDCDVIRALDPERSREGRWDLRVWLVWDPASGLNDLLKLALIAGEGTLRSDFGSHRLWIHLESDQGSGRIALETMDCRLYRADKVGAADLLHKATWAEL